MATISTLWNTLTDQIVHTKRQLPSTIRIPDSNIEEFQELGRPFVPNQHYFHVVINEMFLVDERKWFSEIDPVILVVSEFTYNKNKDFAVPFIVGPSLLNKFGAEKVPSGMIFRNTSVSGTFPYRGGGLTLSVVLCQATVRNHASELLQLIDKTAKALDCSPMLSPYLKVAEVVMDGFQSLLKQEGTKPLIGLRQSFAPDAGIPFTSGVFALIDEPGIDPDSLWVINKQLHRGSTKGDAVPYRNGDFVLYSVVQPLNNLREDLDTLPFTLLWDQVVSEAIKGSDDAYKSAKVNMAGLIQALTLSPDLTCPHVDLLVKSYTEQMALVHERALNMAQRGGGNADEFADARARSLAVLNL